MGKARNRLTNQARRLGCNAALQHAPAAHERLGEALKDYEDAFVEAFELDFDNCRLDYGRPSPEMHRIGELCRELSRISGEGPDLIWAAFIEGMRYGARHYYRSHQ